MKKIKLNSFKTRRNMNFLTVFLCLDLLIIFSLIKSSNASYVADAVATADMDVALYAFSSNGLEGENIDSTTINLGSLAPGKTKTYKLEVKNTDSKGNVSDTNIVYSLKIITTNNIGLEYEIYQNSVAESNKVSYTKTTSNDGYGTDFVYYTLESSCLSYESEDIDTYYLEVTFPDKYKTSNYQDLIESIKIQLESKQSVDDSVCGTGG